MTELIVGGLAGLVFTALGTGLGYGVLALLRRTQKRRQLNCPRCGRPGGERATPSGRGASLAIGGVVVLALLFVCGVPYVVISAIILAVRIVNGDPVDPTTVVWGILAVLGGLALGYGAVRYINWYRSFPMVKCSCGWRRADPQIVGGPPP
jgi:hypothetical protein